MLLPALQNTEVAANEVTHHRFVYQGQLTVCLRTPGLCLLMQRVIAASGVSLEHSAIEAQSRRCLSRTHGVKAEFYRKNARVGSSLVQRQVKAQ